jgi:hypothetical protein
VAGLPPPCWAVNEKLVRLVPIAGGVVADGGVGVDEVGVMSWFIPGISERSRPKALEPLAVLEEDEPPDAAAVSPVAPDNKVLLEVEDADDCTAAVPVMDAADETAATLLCCVLLI